MTNVSWNELRETYCPELSQEALNTCSWLQSTAPPPWAVDNTAPVEVCAWLARLYCVHAPNTHRKTQGQFFTPPVVARFMASLSAPLPSDAEVIEPGAGLGVLIAALAEWVTQQKTCLNCNVTAYETEASLRPALMLALGYVRRWLSKHAIRFTFEVRPDDFILSNATRLHPTPLLLDPTPPIHPCLIIANPPYFKIPKTDSRAAILPEVVYGQPNIYALFMAASAKLLQPAGQLIFITPRSFCSGPYFRQFRKWFFQNIALERIHLFESRTATFAHDEVLQENVILKGVQASPQRDAIDISSSHGSHDLEAISVRRVPMRNVLDLNSDDAILSIPLGETDATIQEVFSRWPDCLETLGMEISTGPIVPFRTEALVTDENSAPVAPVIWGQHVGRMTVSWPLEHFPKPQHISIRPDVMHLLLPNSNFVLLRRFSPKEDNSRLTAAPYLKEELSSDFLGVENHVNYIYRPKAMLSANEAVGLAAFLNSRWVDQYFRVSSGNTQVSATEIRHLPLPPLERIQRIGERLRLASGASMVALLNQAVGEELGLPAESKNGNGGHMPKIEEAKDLLRLLGLPPAQRNELAALTLLALANLTESEGWKNAQRRSLRIHDMLLFVEQNYHKRYAENTRETFRRQVLHQFEQARLVDRNPDDPTLSTNSPRTHYAISEALLPVVRTYGTKTGQRQLENFKAEQGTLLEVYQRRRAQRLIPLKDMQGRTYQLSPGKHNELQVAVVEQFAPRFAPGAKLLYIGDTANKTLIMDSDGLAQVGYPANKHSKLPDVVLYWPKRNWLYLIEAVTSHGPVSPKRQREMEALLAASPAERKYVSAFPDFKEYLRHARSVAWETEVWIAEAPDHLIHYNGDKFLQPSPTTKPKSKKR